LIRLPPIFIFDDFKPGRQRHEIRAVMIDRPACRALDSFQQVLRRKIRFRCEVQVLGEPIVGEVALAQTSAPLKRSDWVT